MPEFFKSVKPINLSSSGSRDGLDIFFERVDSPPADDRSVEQLRVDYEETVFILKEMDLPAPDFDTLFNMLVTGAQVGLQGPQYNLESGRTQMNNVRRTLVKRSMKERDNYLGRLIVVGIVVTATSLALAWFVTSELPKFISDTALKATFEKNIRTWLLAGSLLHPGVVLGVVFTGFILNRTMTFEKLRHFDPYYFPPGLRFFYVSVVSYVLFAALWFNVVMLGLGGFLLNSVRETPEAGVLIGLLCGVSEVVVVDLLISRFKPVERAANQQPG